MRAVLTGALVGGALVAAIQLISGPLAERRSRKVGEEVSISFYSLVKLLISRKELKRVTRLAFQEQEKNA